MEYIELIKFYSQASKLKTTLRHCWIGKERRQESVADHSWGIVLLASLIIPKLTIKVNELKALKMLVFHDLPESIVGDIPATVKQDMSKDLIHESEKKGLTELIESLPVKLQKEIIELWEEFEENKTPEAMFANSIDKLEGLIQHDYCEIETWDDKEYPLNVSYREEMFDYDPYMRKLKDYVNHYNYWLIDKAGKLDMLTEEQREYWLKNKQLIDFDNL